MATDPIDGDLEHVLVRNVVDSYAGICGSLRDTDMLERFDRLVGDPLAAGGIPVWGTGRGASLTDAVFANSILGRRSDLLDTYLSPNGMGGSHPSDNVALLLTLAESLPMDGATLLRATYVAFSLSAAYSTYYDAESAGFDHDAAATFTTALTLGHVLGLDEDQLTAAQRIAGMFGLDVNQAAVGQVTDWKHCTFASCASRAVQVVQLARAGFEAPPDIYRGEAGIDRFLPHAERMFDPPPDLSRIIFKRWPALVFCQTPIDVALDLAPQIGDVSEIERIEVRTYELASRNGAIDSAFAPDSRAGRTHSIPYCVATALLKPIAYEDFDAGRAADPDVRALMAKLEVVVDDGFDARYPAEAPCRITVTASDGTARSAERSVPEGDPADPLGDAEIGAKLDTYVDIEGAERADLLARIWDLPDQPGLDWLLAPLRRRRI